MSKPDWLMGSCDVGEMWTDGDRLYEIVKVDQWLIWYKDIYSDGTVENRVTGTILWEVMYEEGRHWRIGER